MKVFRVTAQMLALPGRSSHRKRQFSRVKPSGSNCPGGASPTVSMTRKTYMRTSGADAAASSATMIPLPRALGIAVLRYVSMRGRATRASKLKILR